MEHIAHVQGVVTVVNCSDNACFLKTFAVIDFYRCVCVCVCGGGVIVIETADRGVKETNICHRGPTVHIYICRLVLMPDSLSLVWGRSMHVAKFPILHVFKTLPLQQFSSDPIQTL